MSARDSDCSGGAGQTPQAAGPEGQLNGAALAAIAQPSQSLAPMSDKTKIAVDGEVERVDAIGKFASGRMDDGTPAVFSIEELCGDDGFIGRCVTGSGFVAKPGYIPWANVTVHSTKEAALSDLPHAAERLPPVSHARDCEYVTASGPAACTCDFYDREQAAIRSLSATLGQTEGGQK